jgi:hypothetical protein
LMIQNTTVTSGTRLNAGWVSRVSVSVTRHPAKARVTQASLFQPLPQQDFVDE